MLPVRRAFTLIELLVVIAVIAALAAIIYPVVSRARERGRTTQIISNMRQLAQAINVYMEDNHLRLPPRDPRPLLKNPAVGAIAYYAHKMATREEMDNAPRDEVPFLGDYVYCRCVLELTPDEHWSYYWGRISASPVLLVSLHDARLTKLPRQTRDGPAVVDPLAESDPPQWIMMPDHVWRCRLDTSVHVMRFSKNMQQHFRFDYDQLCYQRPLDRRESK